MASKYSPWKSFYYRNKSILIAAPVIILTVSVVYTSCFRPSSSIYESMFGGKPDKSIQFYDKQDCYVFACCLWLHFKIDSSELSKLLLKDFRLKKTHSVAWSGVVPPEAKNWWHPEKLGNDVLYFERKPDSENDRTILGLYTSERKDEVYAVLYLN